MRAHTEGKNEMGRRFLLAAGLIIAVVVPSASFVARSHAADSEGEFGTIFTQTRQDQNGGGVTMEVAPGNGKYKRVKILRFWGFRVNCPKSGPTTVQTELDEPITGNIVRSEIAIDAAVQHRRWHFNDLVLAAVGRNSGERIDASINFQGKFRKHKKNKADGTLELTLEGVNFGSGPEDCHRVQVFHLHRGYG